MGKVGDLTLVGIMRINYRGNGGFRLDDVHIRELGVGGGALLACRC